MNKKWGWSVYDFYEIGKSNTFVTIANSQITIGDQTQIYFEMVTKRKYTFWNGDQMQKTPFFYVMHPTILCGHALGY